MKQCTGKLILAEVLDGGSGRLMIAPTGEDAITIHCTLDEANAVLSKCPLGSEVQLSNLIEPAPKKAAT